MQKEEYCVANLQKLAIQLRGVNPDETQRRDFSFIELFLDLTEASLVREDGEFGPRVLLQILSLERVTVAGQPIRVKMKCLIQPIAGERTEGYRFGEFSFVFEPTPQDESWLFASLPPEMLLVDG